MLWSLLFIPLIGSVDNDNTATALCKKQTLNATTSQSSNYTDGNNVYSSERAVDGNTTQCSHTLALPNSWWRIDLLGVYNISCIAIYNVNQKHTNISGAQIHVGSSRENNGTANSICQNITNIQLDTWNNYTCDKSISGRYVSVFVPQASFLVLCEVKIYGEIKDSPYVLIRENKTWEDALYYCRDKHGDLASIVDEDDQAWAELEAKKADTGFVWLGLHFTCTLDFWFWVDDQRVGFSRWSPGEKDEKCDMSGAMETQESHQWFSKSDYEAFNFICAK